MTYYGLPTKPRKPWKQVAREKTIKKPLTPKNFVAQWKAFAKEWGVSEDQVTLHEGYFGPLNFRCYTEESEDEFANRVKEYDKIKAKNDKHEAAQKVRELKSKADMARQEQQEIAGMVDVIASVLASDTQLRNQVLSQVEAKKPAKKAAKK